MAVTEQTAGFIWQQLSTDWCESNGLGQPVSASTPAGQRKSATNRDNLGTNVVSASVNMAKILLNR